MRLASSMMFVDEALRVPGKGHIMPQHHTPVLGCSCPRCREASGSVERDLRSDHVTIIGTAPRRAPRYLVVTDPPEQGWTLR